MCRPGRVPAAEELAGGGGKLLMSELMRRAQTGESMGSLDEMMKMSQVSLKLFKEAKR